MMPRFKHLPGIGGHTSFAIVGNKQPAEGLGNGDGAGPEVPI
jgi:hypothetical protein